MLWNQRSVNFNWKLIQKVTVKKKGPLKSGFKSVSQFFIAASGILSIIHLSTVNLLKFSPNGGSLVK